MSTDLGPAATSRYKRPTIQKLEGEAGKEALAAYLQHYAKLAATEPALLNQKIPRDTFSQVLHEVGSLLLAKAEQMSLSDQKVKGFLQANPLPDCLGEKLTPQIRTFCLLLNALSQWAISEKLAMDRFLFSGNVRKKLRAVARTCPVSGENLLEETVELHHPLRDGRPPIPLSRKGHERVEELLRPDENDPAGQILMNFRKNGRPTWKSLRMGCMIENGDYEDDGAASPSKVQRARASVRRATVQTGLTCAIILTVLDKYELGLKS